jgi:hypothetical protein
MRIFKIIDRTTVEQPTVCIEEEDPRRLFHYPGMRHCPLGIVQQRET